MWALVSSVRLTTNKSLAANARRLFIPYTDKEMIQRGKNLKLLQMKALEINMLILRSSQDNNFKSSMDKKNTSTKTIRNPPTPKPD